MGGRSGLAAGQGGDPLGEMMAHGELDEVIELLLSLPPSTRELPGLMSRLVLGLARAGMYEHLEKVLPELLHRFAPGPEITRTLLELADILWGQGHLEETFTAIEDDVVHGYCMTAADLTRRLARCCRSSGHPGVADRLMDVWNPGAQDE